MDKIIIEGIDYTSGNKLIYSKNKSKQKCYEEVLNVLDNYEFRNIKEKDVQKIVEFIYNNNL